MKVEIDTRGLACPAPVLKTKETIEKKRPLEITVLVDNEAARQNVARFLESQGFSVVAEQSKEGVKIIGLFEDEACLSSIQQDEQIEKEENHNKTLIIITNDKIGHGDDILGKKLMQNFINTLKEMDNLWRLILMNNGVKLAVSNSPLLPSLKELIDMGIQIFVCGTCLEHFGILDKKEIGETTNMLDIITSLQLADKVIHI